MKIIDAEFVTVNSVYFEFIVYLRYKTWFLGKEKLKTVFRSTREGYSSDVSSYKAWYDAETGRILPESWCMDLDRYYYDKPHKDMLQDQTKELARLRCEHTEEISKWAQQTSNKSK
jgi:hypothetical protein